MFDTPGPRWFSIAADRPFVDDLAGELVRRLTPLGPTALADATVLTPTRRAARSLAEAFVRAGEGKATLLPQIRAVGDLEEAEPPFEAGSLALDLPAAIEPRRRRLELARLAWSRRSALERADMDAAGALAWADVLGAFLDSCQLEEVDPAGRIESLVDIDLAQHWRSSTEFLQAALVDWPARLRELGLIDATERRVRLLNALAEQWRRSPPPGVLIAAGSTGTAPATADLLAVVAAAPQGAVVLPGLDHELAEEAWRVVGGDEGEQHPQGAMKRLLDRAGVARAQVRPWPAPQAPANAARGRARRRLVNEALRPAEATADWLEQIGALQAEGEDVIADGLTGLSLASARTEQEAAAVAALLLRETLETPGKTAALVTPDRDLARRVSAKLTRWGVSADSSAGAPLASFPVGALIGFTAALAEDPAEPIALLGALKHPLTRLGLDPDVKFRGAPRLEARALRGARPRRWADIDGRINPKAPVRRDDETEEAHRGRTEREVAHANEAEAVAAPLRQAVLDFAAAFMAGPVSLARAARAHVRCLEALAADAAGRLGGLWAGPDGELAAALFADLVDAPDALPPVDARGWRATVEAVLEAETVRTGGATHPRLRILGAIEARLVRADRMVLAGLEEGVWPRPAPTDALLSRPMRKALGLPPPERRLGLSAHDFAQAACAPEVFLLRTERRGGAPTVQSRWLWRLETLLGGAKRKPPSATHVVAWARALDTPGPFKPAPRPRPKPLLEVRPRGLAVTRIETWVRDPYNVYARDILRLRELDPPGARIEAMSRGTAIHAALERFADSFDALAPAERPETFARFMLEALAEAGVDDAMLAQERVLALNVGGWLAEWETERRADGRTRLVEQRGASTLLLDGEPFALSAKADRIEVVDGRAEVLDFKTGTPPSAKQVESDFAPQLTLTAAILAAGGFEALGPTPPGALSYVRVTGRRPPAKLCTVTEAPEADAAAERAVRGLESRVRAFRDPERGYESWAAPQWRKYDGPYDHLARVWEWMTLGADEDDPTPP